MKKCLILVVSSQHSPYDVMPLTSLHTWDSVEVEGVETVYYFGSPIKENNDKFIYFNVNECYQTMGIKTLMAFEWASQNKDFDYVLRANASTYVDKKKLIEYIQGLPDENVANGLVVTSGHQYDFNWCWGCHYILSKDVVKRLVEIKDRIDVTLMDDVGLSKMLHELNVPLSDIRSCTIDKINDGWRFLCYGSASMEFEDWTDVKKLDNQFLFRCKQDNARWADKMIMEKLFENLK